MSGKQMTDEEYGNEIQRLTSMVGQLLLQNTDRDLEIMDRYSIISSTLINVLSKYIVATSATVEMYGEGKSNTVDTSLELMKLAKDLLEEAVTAEANEAEENLSEVEETVKKDDIKWN